MTPGTLASFDDGYYYKENGVGDEHRYRIYKVTDGGLFGGDVLQIVRSFYTYGPATDEDFEREIGEEDEGSYVVYPFDACQEFEVVRPASSVKRLVRDGKSV